VGEKLGFHQEERQSLWELGPAAEAWLTELVRRRPAQWRLDVEQCFGLPQAPGPERLDAGFGKNRTYCVSHVVLVCGYNSVGYHRAAIASRRKVATPREGASTSGPPRGSVLRIPPSLLPWADPRD
jgi:hypothetical protein